MSDLKIVIIPGNGGCDVLRDHWHPWLKKELEKHHIHVVAKNMPDPFLARMKYWLPFMEKELQCDENTVVIGHSSGAEAVMRYLETHTLRGAILVSACYTDLGLLEEKMSGYYSHPWLWSEMKDHAEWIAQFHSLNDPFIPVTEARYVHEHLGTEYHELEDGGHFIATAVFPELLEVILKKVRIHE